MYFADTEATAWAEWYRALAEFAIPPDRQMPRDPWRWHVDVGRREWPAFQTVGEQLWGDGFRGMIAGTAAASAVLVAVASADTTGAGSRAASMAG